MYTYYVEVWTVNGWIGRGPYNNLRDIESECGGYAIRVYRMSRGLYRDGRNPYGWDAPTFKMQSTRIRADHVPELLAQ